MDVSWTKLTDLSTHEGKLLGASCSNSFVGVWVVDLARCEPFHSGKDVGPGGGGTRDAPDRRGEFDEKGLEQWCKANPQKVKPTEVVTLTATALLDGFARKKFSSEYVMRCLVARAKPSSTAVSSASPPSAMIHSENAE